MKTKWMYNSCYAPKDMNEELLLADQGREKIAKRIFGDYKVMYAEEYVTRSSRTIGSSSFDQYRYSNEKTSDFLHRAHLLINTIVKANKQKKQYLSEEEISQMMTICALSCEIAS